MAEPTPEELKEVEELMKKPEITYAVSMLLAGWKLYWLARADLFARAKGKLDNKKFAILSEALSKAACAGFKIGRFKNNVKNEVLPYLKKLAAAEATTENRNGTGQDPRDAGGDEPSNA